MYVCSFNHLKAHRSKAQWTVVKCPQLCPLCNVLSCHSQSIYRLKKACHGELDEDCNLLTPDQVVDRIFELVDENGDGEFM